MNRNHRWIKLSTLALCSLVWACSPPSDEVSHVGQAESGCRVLDPDISDSYIGECRDGLAHGQGEARGRDIYIGGFYAGEAHGTGRNMWGPTSQWANHTYEGDWVHGERTGTGIYRSPRYEYEGQFLRGKHHGTGKYTVHGDFVYDGQFVDNLMHGEGELVLRTSGGVYKGEFKNDSMDGYGLITYSDGIQFEGQFRNNQFDGIGEARTPRSATIGIDLDKDGFWRDDFFVVRGYWRESELIVACDTIEDCEKEWAKLGEAKKAEAAAKDPIAAAKKREALVAKERQECEARSKICLAECNADASQKNCIQHCGVKVGFCALILNPRGSQESRESREATRQREDSARQARMQCEAQKKTCLAGCSAGTDSYDCRSTCNKIFCY